MKLSLLTINLDANQRFIIIPTVWLNFKRPEFDIFLDNGITEFSPNQPLGIKNSVLRVTNHTTFGTVSNYAIVSFERYKWRHRLPALFVFNDFHTSIFPDSDARASRTKINSNCYIWFWPLFHIDFSSCVCKCWVSHYQLIYTFFFCSRKSR